MHIAEQKKIRIRLRAYDHNILDTSCKKMIDVLKQEDNTQYSLVPLPTRRRIYCVLRSPHVNKDSREHFEIRTHQRIVDLYKPSVKAIDSLIKLDLPAGVDVEIKI
jgi:small subunit ribosomal protein S10